jgi:hypothetical protein
VHPEKHDSQIISTEAGREIDFKSLWENVDFSSRDNFESASIATLVKEE